MSYKTKKNDGVRSRILQLKDEVGSFSDLSLLSGVRENTIRAAAKRGGMRKDNLARLEQAVARRVIAKGLQGR